MVNQSKEKEKEKKPIPAESKGQTIADIAAQSAKTENEKKKPIIEVRNLNKYYMVGKNRIDVVKNINIKIYPQEFIVILGPSGSGKSTLLNHMIGLETPSSGSVIVNGDVISNKKPNQIAKFRFKHYGIVFQRAEWVRSISVLDNVALPLAINNIGKSERNKKAQQYLKDLGMETHANYLPTELSGGQQQKVTIARALMNNPPIIVADEPTGNLDTNSADRVMTLLKNFNEKDKKTILMVTHNIDYVRYASRTVYIRDGNVVQGSEQFLGG
ncbi:ABC transporter ATP-binding protein [Patescibacteria group bacterium]|nr:ABC transporter ATP-binding protein [Patescibacteria group bacterium]